MAEKMGEQKYVWYFAFGSNMNTKALNIRRVNPLEKRPAKLNGWILNFDIKGYPFFEPAFANMTESQDSIVHGVCFKITQSEWEGIKVTEGEGIKEKLKPIEVEVEQYDGKKIKAKTLISTSNSHSKNNPSKQYLNLLIEGAEENKLDRAYIDWVKSHKSYVFREHVKSKMLYPFCLWLIMVLIPFAVGKLLVSSVITKIEIGKRFHFLIMKPIFLINFFVYVFAWKFHDLLYSIFGPFGLMHVESLS